MSMHIWFILNYTLHIIHTRYCYVIRDTLYICICTYHYLSFAKSTESIHLRYSRQFMHRQFMQHKLMMMMMTMIMLYGITRLMAKYFFLRSFCPSVHSFIRLSFCLIQFMYFFFQMKIESCFFVILTQTECVYNCHPIAHMLPHYISDERGFLFDDDVYLFICLPSSSFHVMYQAKLIFIRKYINTHDFC